MRTSIKTTFGALRAIVASGVLAAPMAFVPAAAHAQSAPIPSGAAYSCDFENGYCDFLEQSKLGDAPGAARRSSILNSARNGSFGVRLHTEPGDNSVHGSGTWERDDLEKAPDASYCNQGQEEWWAASVMFPSDYSFPAPGQGGVIIDFHHNADSGVPPFGLEVRGESGMRISGYGGPALNGGQYRVQIADPWGAVNNVTHNVWYDFVFHIKWSSGGDGFSEAWLNGKKVLSYSGATAYSGISCYLKLANYHDATGQPSSIIFDRIVRGTSAATVAIGPLEGVNGAAAPANTAAGTTPPATGTGSGSSSGSGSTSGSGSGSGSGSPSSATMDSSNYTSAAGSSVTFTARIMGNASTPSGRVSFASDGATIAGCSSVTLSGGAAQCTTSSLPGGQHKITGAYSGDSAYGSAQAGPITQMVSTTFDASSPSGSNGSISASGTSATSAAAAIDLEARKIDFDGDGKSDLIFQHEDGSLRVNLMNGTSSTANATIVGATSNAVALKAGDFNGDGKTDLVRSFSDGSAIVYLMNGTSIASQATIRAAGSGYKVVHVGDFNGDGKTDIVWEAADGSTQVTLMNGTSFASSSTLMQGGQGWHVAFVGDFDGDGKSDLVWVNDNGAVSLWLMNGTNFASRATLMAAGSGWKPVKVADLDGDGKADIMWRYSDGSTSVWTMNGVSTMKRGSIMAGQPNWSPVLLLDANGDGAQDIAWQSSAGDVGLWLMKGITLASHAALMAAGSGWSVSSSGDFNGDGKSDLVWTGSDGSVGVWLMNGTAVSSRASLQGPGTGWSVLH